MINLIVAYYENIWPFQGKCCSLFFDEWKYLIKAPIWSGKSFLFFDAPRYALYRNSSRNMLNLKSKTWEICMIFEVDWLYYMVKRLLSRTPQWNDSCKSRIFLINYDGENLLKDIKNLTWNDEILQWWVDAIQLFESENKKLWEITEISEKNETEVQSRLEEILPSKDVFLNTVFLLQNANNIFEEWEKNRIDILKRVFDLVWFDGAVEIVKERRKDVDSRMKALFDTSLLDDKLRSNMKLLYDKIWKLKDDDELNPILSKNDEFFEPIEMSLDRLLINNFTLNWFDKSVYDDVEKLLHKKMDVIARLDTQLSAYQKQLSDLDQQKIKVWNDIKAAKSNVSDLVKRIENIDAKKWEELEQKIVELNEQKDDLNKSMNYSDFSGLIDHWNKNVEWDVDVVNFQLPFDLESACDILSKVKEKGKDLDWNIVTWKRDLKDIELGETHWKEIHIRDVEKLKELKKSNDDKIKFYQDEIQKLDKAWEESSDFDCRDLWKKCPYISAINKQQYDHYSKKKVELTQTLETLMSDYKKHDFDKELKELENQKCPEKVEEKRELEKNIKEKTEFLDSLREYLQKIWFAEYEKSYAKLKAIQREIESVVKQQTQWKEESKNLEKYQQDLIAARTSIQHFEKSLQEFDSQTTELNSKIDWVKNEKENSNYLQIEWQWEDLKRILLCISNIEGLIQDNLNNAILLKKLDEEKKKLKNLIYDLSTGVIIYNLSKHLPLLSDAINDYLSQCVDYSIRMDTVEKEVKDWTEIELEIRVFDDKWEREVKSLSGGQRTILNLVRMLAVSSYLKTPLLFLDETINNLDIDTVWRVSEMINNFVKQRTMKFYTVTHNKEIQDMPIWDDVIEIGWVVN